MLPDVKCVTAEGNIQQAEAQDLIEKAEREEWRLDRDHRE